MKRDTPSYHGYRFPPEIISHAVWLYHRFGVSFRDVEDLLAQRSIMVSYEAIRLWCLTFGSAYARRLTRRQGRLGDTWHLDEVLRHHPGTAALSLVCRRSRWRRPRYPCPVASQLPGCQTLFSQVDEGPREQARAIGHRQAEQLQGCAPRGHAVRRSQYGPIREHSRRSLSPAHTATRATNATVHISRSRTTILVRAWTRPESVPRWPSPVASGASSKATRSLFPHLGCSHDRRLTRTEITIPSTDSLDER